MDYQSFEHERKGLDMNYKSQVSVCLRDSVEPEAAGPHPLVSRCQGEIGIGPLPKSMDRRNGHLIALTGRKVKLAKPRVGCNDAGSPFTRGVQCWVKAGEQMRRRRDLHLGCCRAPGGIPARSINLLTTPLPENL